MYNLISSERNENFSLIITFLILKHFYQTVTNYFFRREKKGSKNSKYLKNYNKLL